MVPIRIPENGVSIQGAPCSITDGEIASDGGHNQVMRLDLATGVLENIMKASRMGKDIHMSFGKTITIQYGTRTQQLLSIAQPTQSELYKYSPDKEDELRFAGLMTHKLAQKKVEENTAGADAALAALQSKMASHQQTKQSKQIKVLSETPTTSPTMKSTHPKPKGTNFLAALKGQPLKRPMTPLNNAMTRSTPVSPAVTASRPSQSTPAAPRSAPAVQDEKAQKFQALKIPLVHLIAIRPMSLKFLANKVGCSQDECGQVLHKIGKPARLDPTKWDLADKAFKDLDVWKFDYEDEEDRKLAIENAIFAYDRMRLSRDDKLWQMLLPMAERGKGKVSSRLRLHQGPIQKSSTPKIHVQRTAEDQMIENTADLEGDEKHHLAPSDVPMMARSQSSDPVKKKRVSEKEAQSKRLSSTKPKKASVVSKANDATKKRVTKKGGSCGPIVKSEEFVRDSDEDAETGHAPPSTAKPSASRSSAVNTKSQARKSVPESDNAIELLQQLEKDRKRLKTANGSSRPDAIGSKRPPSTSGTPSSKHRVSDAGQSSASNSKLSRQRTTSSPLKPSPLGSSPPTNASDLENNSQPLHTSNSSTSSTPLIAQAGSLPVNTKPRPDAGKRLPKPAKNTSEHSLKRKADDMDSGMHNHNVPFTNGHSSPPSKRSKTSAPTPPATDSSSSDSSPIPNSILSQAQLFKECYKTYEHLYLEVSAQAHPSPEKIDGVVKMHKQLQAMKDEIARAAARC
ncbi:MAG: hypothetical protein LQ343_005971 [Gyalolechia ehrenbergii]|nr:MAG: hypothetical protein LQ343_005971 [Gyalolechia ehrenbergii]